MSVEQEDPGMPSDDPFEGELEGAPATDPEVPKKAYTVEIRKTLTAHVPVKATSFDDAKDRAMAAVVEDDFAFPQLKVVAVSRDDD